MELKSKNVIKVLSGLKSEATSIGFALDKIETVDPTLIVPVKEKVVELIGNIDGMVKIIEFGVDE